MQKVSKPGSPVLQRISIRLKSRPPADSTGRRNRKASLLVVLFSCVLLLLAVLIIYTRFYKSADVELSYTQPITAVHASDASAGESLSASMDINTPAGHPQADLSDGFYDFGTISREAVVQRDFLLVNHGDAPLLIREAHTTCGCTTANLTASIIPPGQASRITMIFNAGYHDVAGQTVRRGLLMTTNDPNHPELEIWVQASVR